VALKSIDLVKNGTLKVHEGAPYGTYQTELDRDIFDFIQK